MKIIGPFFGGVAAVTLAILTLHNIVPTASAEATRVVTITDPILNMQAYSLSIPTNWIFDGAVVPGTSCNDGPFPVFRMMSPMGSRASSSCRGLTGHGRTTMESR
jgi:hypothetical protein